MTRDNDPGSYRTTKAAMMRSFDQLPPSARAALANAVCNWVPQPILTGYRRQLSGYETDAKIAEMIEFWNCLALKEHEAQRRSATGPYKGNAPDPGYVKITGRRPRGAHR